MFNYFLSLLFFLNFETAVSSDGSSLIKFWIFTSDESETILKLVSFKDLSSFTILGVYSLWLTTFMLFPLRVK